MHNLTVWLVLTLEGDCLLRSFIALKQALTTAASLAVPDDKDPFFLDIVHSRKGRKERVNECECVCVNGSVLCTCAVELQCTINIKSTGGAPI